MIIPCIDLMGGKAVQLIQGKDKALERTVKEAAAMFEGFPLLHVIDLDAAMGSGDNQEVVFDLLRSRRVRVGGGIRSVAKAKALVDAGAHQVIVGSAAFTASGVNSSFLAELVKEVGISRVMVAIDTKGGQVVVDAWKTSLDQTPADAIQALEPFCGGFLCTNVDKEGLLQGTNLDLFLSLRSFTEKTLVAAGGVTTMEEVLTLTGAGIEVALGMAIYTGLLNLEDLLKHCSPIPASSVD